MCVPTTNSVAPAYRQPAPLSAAGRHPPARHRAAQPSAPGQSTTWPVPGAPLKFPAGPYLPCSLGHPRRSQDLIGQAMHCRWRLAIVIAIRLPPKHRRRAALRGSGRAAVAAAPQALRATAIRQLPAYMRESPPPVCAPSHCRPQPQDPPSTSADPALNTVPVPGLAAKKKARRPSLPLAVLCAPGAAIQWQLQCGLLLKDYEIKFGIERRIASAPRCHLRRAACM